MLPNGGRTLVAGGRGEAGVKEGGSLSRCGRGFAVLSGEPWDQRTGGAHCQHIQKLGWGRTVRLSLLACSVTFAVEVGVPQHPEKNPRKTRADVHRMTEGMISTQTWNAQCKRKKPSRAFGL